jgi:RNA polymerase nonessential primary-like sigma factor
MLQGGLIGLLRGIEKFDASRGFRISTYVYWWIRQVRADFLALQQYGPDQMTTDLSFKDDS